MCQEPTELLWIGCLTGLILILNFRFDTLILNINSQTFGPKVILEVFSLDAGPVTEGIPTRDLWDLISEVLHSSARGNSVHTDDSALGNLKPKMRENGQTKQKCLTSGDSILEEIDYVPPPSKNPAELPYCLSLRTTKQ